MRQACRREKINAFHNQLLYNQDSPGYYLSGWSSLSSQAARFAALVRASWFTGGSVVDFGCGTGDLYSYLCSLPYDFSYIGVDQNQNMLDVARGRYDADFRLVEIDDTDFPESDYVFSSGVFQFRDLSYEYYYIDLIRSLFKKSKKSTTLNLLSALREDCSKVDDELYFSPSEALNVAVSVSPFFVLDHSYHIGSGDMTIALHRNEIRSDWIRPANT